MNNGAWRDQAECAGTDVDVFFPNTKGRATWTESRAICSECPVIDECLEETMRLEGPGASQSVRFGMFGGLSPTERMELDALRAAMEVAS